MTRSTDEILDEAAGTGEKPSRPEELRAAIAEMTDDPNSQFNLMRVLVDRLRKRLGVSAESEAGQAIGNAIVRAVWLGEGSSPELVLSESDPLHNVAGLPGVDIAAAAAANLHDLQLVTSKSYPPQTMLDRAAKADLETVLIIGYGKDDELNFWSSIADGPECLWMLELAKRELLELAKRELLDITDHRTGEIPPQVAG